MNSPEKLSSAGTTPNKQVRGADRPSDHRGCPPEQPWLKVRTGVAKSPCKCGSHAGIYIRQEIQHDAPDSVPTAEELFTFFRSPDAPTELDTYQQMLVTDKLLEYAEISLRTLCDLIRYQQFKELGVVHSAKEFIQLFHPDEQEDTP